jgi:FAD/FMN-containing dehydrogenase
VSYPGKKEKVVKSLLRLQSRGKISLKPKFTSHFFRNRKKKNKLDLNKFNKILKVDVKNKIVEVEGMCTFYDLAREVLKYGLLPVIVPELRNITIGGAISGLGLESSSFIYGMVHNSVIECDVLISTGKIITCSRIQNKDLFYLLPNSIGSVGYVLKCKFKLKEAKKYVKISFVRHESAAEYFKDLKKKCKSMEVDFIDGVVFGNEHYVIIEGKLTNELPSAIKPRNFRMYPYWRFIADKNNVDLYMTIWDYLWRWDTDVFWSISGGWVGKLTENRLFRFTLGRYFLRSHILGKINHLNRRCFKPYGTDKKETILQDLCIGIDKCVDFIDWYNRKIFVYPIWICPILNRESQGKYVLHNFKLDYLVDIGIYAGKPQKAGKPKNYYNRLLEKKVLELKGMKGLYSESHFTKDEFWKIYDKDKYFKYKRRFDPEGIFPDIYSKTVGSETL